MFNKKLTDGIPDIYQNPLAESALQKTFIPCKIKIKLMIKLMKQSLRAVPPKQPFTKQIIK